MARWSVSQFLVFVAFVLFVIALITALAWTSKLSNASAWGFAGLAVLAASFLPWRTSP